jgi:hypothetical protein
MYEAYGADAEIIARGSYGPVQVVIGFTTQSILAHLAHSAYLFPNKYAVSLSRSSVYGR